MKLLSLENLPKGLALSISDRNWAHWQGDLFTKFAARHKDKPAVEAAAEAKKLVPAGIANSQWFAKVIIVAQACELDLEVSSYDEALVALTQYQKANTTVRVDNSEEPSIQATTKPALVFDINDIDLSKEFTITREALEKKDPFSIAYIQALAKRHGDRKIAYRAIQHDEKYGYKYDAIGLTGQVLFNPSRIGTIYGDGSRSFYRFTDESNGLSGYKQITFYPNIVELKEGESITLRRNDLQNLEKIKILSFGLLSNYRYNILLCGPKGRLNLTNASICVGGIKVKDGNIQLEFLVNHGEKIINVNEEVEIMITRIPYVPQRRRFR